MTVVVLRNYDPRTIGIVSRWMLHVSPGVFVACLSDRVRDKVLKLIVERNPASNGVMCFADESEQGFQIMMIGNPTYSKEDFDGISLIVKPLRGSRVKK